METNPRPELVLRCTAGIGAAGYRQRVRLLGAAQAVAALPVATRHEALGRANAVERACHDRRIAIVVLGDAGYPRKLERLEDPPPVIFSLGVNETSTRPTVAVVGSRDATSYGLRVTRRLVQGLVGRGVAVISGMARGIDAEAHRATLDAQGYTVAVLGTGVDVPYPVQHEELHAAIAASGGWLLSESLPGAHAHAGAFPRRNRLIAALADVTIVVEAGPRSGALITARLAAELGRSVGAVPGPVDVGASMGCNALLRDGAQVVCDVDDVLGLLALAPDCDLRARGEAAASLHPQEGDALERRILDSLRMAPRLPDELVAVSGRGARDIAVALANLTLRGLVAIDETGLARPA